MAGAVRWITTPVGAMVAAALTIAVIVVIAVSGGEKDEPAATPQAPNPPAPVTASELSSFSESTGLPVYWAGGRKGEKYELTRVGNERISVRYPTSLTVATYKLDDAMAAIRRAGRSETAKLYRLSGGGLAVHDSARPTNAYLAYRGEPYQVEVFHPEPGRSLRLVLAGRVRPVP